jgi:hypothetical protein
MNSLDWVNKEIKKTLKTYKAFKLDYDLFLRESDKRDYQKAKLKLKYLKQIKSKLEIMELIENGWSSIEQTVSGEKIIKFEKLNLDDWLKIWKTLEEIGLKKY